MASSTSDSQDRTRLNKFTKILTLKVAQIVVQSRQGKKITHDFNVARMPENTVPLSPTNVQWFNLCIPDEPDVECDTKQVLNGEVVTALSNVLCIEISLKTAEGDEMVLELWTVRVTPEHDMAIGSLSSIYYRMSVLLKSTLSISRVTPAYKMARAQHKESYNIYHKIYGGLPNMELLGENYKCIKISELKTPIGAILVEVAHRTRMTILPDNRQKVTAYEKKPVSEDIMVKSDHFPVETARKPQNDKKSLDLGRPLTAGAFVDVDKIKELHTQLRLQLPPEPRVSWLLDNEKKLEQLELSDDVATSVSSSELASQCQSVPHASSKAIEVPQRKRDQCTGLLEFPFADGSPIADLANFYQECLQAKSASDDWTDLVQELPTSTDSDMLSKQLKMFEEAVPEFDNMVASMFSNSDKSDAS